jgi:hypothetical protein
LSSRERHGRGLGNALLGRLVTVGADEKFSTLKGDTLPDNRDVARICEKLGFTLKSASWKTRSSRPSAAMRVNTPAVP